MKAEEFILLKVTTAKNVWFVTIGFSIMDSNFKIMYSMLSRFYNVKC